MNAASVFLLVEPSPILHPRLQDWLESVLMKPHIFTAENGLEALNLAAQEQPTHILIEMDLPDISSLVVLKQIRQSLPTARIIATGWYDSRFFLNSVQSAGADGFILKNRLYRELLPLWQVLPE